MDGGEETIIQVDEVLNNLVEKQFGSLQTLLEARADISILSGAALALGHVRDVPTKRALKKMASDALKRLEPVLGRLEEMGLDAFRAKKVREGVELFSYTLTASRKELKDSRKEVLSARNASVRPLTQAMERMVFTLSVAATQASADNRTAIQDLLDNQVEVLLRLLEINAGPARSRLPRWIWRRHTALRLPMQPQPRCRKRPPRCRATQSSAAASLQRNWKV